MGTVERWTADLERDAFAERWRRFAAADDDAEDPAETGPSIPDPADVSPAGSRDAREPLPIAVVEQDLPAGLFGFTRRDSDHVTVSSRLYKVDRERTVRHERTHHRHPKDELTVRYINGDIDVENTLSFRADRRTGRRVRPDRAAAYGARDTYTGAGTDRDDTYGVHDAATL